LTDVGVATAQVMRGFPPPPEHRVLLEQAYAETRFTNWFMRHVRELAGTADVSSRHAPVAPLPEERMRLDDVRVGKAGGGEWSFSDMLRGTCVDGIIVLRRGRMVYEIGRASCRERV
jgi:hypothetical protein